MDPDDDDSDDELDENSLDSDEVDSNDELDEDWDPDEDDSNDELNEDWEPDDDDSDDELDESSLDSEEVDSNEELDEDWDSDDNDSDDELDENWDTDEVDSNEELDEDWDPDDVDSNKELDKDSRDQEVYNENFNENDNQNQTILVIQEPSLEPNQEPKESAAEYNARDFEEQKGPSQEEVDREAETSGIPTRDASEEPQSEPIQEPKESVAEYNARDFEEQKGPSQEEVDREAETSSIPTRDASEESISEPIQEPKESVAEYNARDFEEQKGPSQEEINREAEVTDIPTRDASVESHSEPTQEPKESVAEYNARDFEEQKGPKQEEVEREAEISGVPTRDASEESHSEPTQEPKETVAEYNARDFEEQEGPSQEEVNREAETSDVPTRDASEESQLEKNIESSRDPSQYTSQESIQNEPQNYRTIRSSEQQKSIRELKELIEIIYQKEQENERNQNADFKKHFQHEGDETRVVKENYENPLNRQQDKNFQSLNLQIIQGSSQEASDQPQENKSQDKEQGDTAEEQQKEQKKEIKEKSTHQNNNEVNEKLSESKSEESTEMQVLQKEYIKETGKKPTHAGNYTKGFEAWLQKKKQGSTTESKEPAEEWEKTLKDWVNGADEKEVTKEIKDELFKIITTFSELRKNFPRLRQLRQKFLNKNIANDEIEELIKLIEKVKNLDPKFEDLFKNLHAFRNFYLANEIWYKDRILAEKEKFTKFLAQKLQLLKSKKLRIESNKKNNDMDSIDMTTQYFQEYCYDYNEWAFYDIKALDLLDNVRKEEKFDYSSFLKVVLDLIEKNELEFVKLERSIEPKIGLQISNEGRLIRGKDNRFNTFNISRILGVPEGTFKTWKGYLKNKVKFKINPATFKKIQISLVRFSNIDAFYLPISKLIPAHVSEQKFIDVLLNIFNNYCENVPSGSASMNWLSKLLKKPRNFIYDFSESLGEISVQSKIFYSKYFNLLTLIYMLGSNLKLKPGRKLKDLQMECHELVFQFMKDNKLIRSLDTLFDKKYKGVYKSRIDAGLFSQDNQELFDIIVHALIALTKVYRARNPKKSKFLFPLSRLSEMASTSSLDILLSNKFKTGHPLARRQGFNLIENLRKYFFDSPNPEEFHDVIYEIRKHISRPYWYWQKYNEHFHDLLLPQLKALLDLTLGLNLFDPETGFLNDAHQRITKKGKVLPSLEMDCLRHHLLKGTTGYLIFERTNNGKLRFMQAPFNEKSHNRIHGKSKALYNQYMKLFNARLMHLYKLVKRPRSESITLDDFRNDKLGGIWDIYENDILKNWIKKWNKKNEMSESEWYGEYYPRFYNEMYEPFMNDFSLYKHNDPSCQYPEFWWWYETHYLREEPFKI